MNFTINGYQHYVYQASSKIQQGDHIGVLMTNIEIPQYDGPIHHHGIVSHVAANHEIKIIHIINCLIMNVFVIPMILKCLLINGLDYFHFIFFVIFKQYV